MKNNEIKLYYGAVSTGNTIFVWLYDNKISFLHATHILAHSHSLVDTQNIKHFYRRVRCVNETNE